MTITIKEAVVKPIPERFKPGEIETKWQKEWEKNKLYTLDLKAAKKAFGKPYYNLMMFPYPSAEGLHVGNMYAFTGVDIHGRFQRMRGYDVFEPIGLDGFGIHSENYALKVNRHPKEQAKVSEANFYRQLKAIGNMFDWTRTVETYDPDYYRWTQWLFVQMFKKGLAYRAKAEVNWCQTCKTVLADEQVIEGKCERTGDQVEKKLLEQWFFRITNYAERLLQNTYKPSFKWPNKVKLGQRNWIGKKEGINIQYPISNIKYQIEVFTTRPDTNFGATFIVVSPEHPDILKFATEEHAAEVKNYIKEAQTKTDDERKVEGRKKTGVFTGSYAINQLTQDKMPLYVADFVLMDVGTGAVVGVPGHDRRDFEFATAMKLPIKRVVVGLDGDTSEITKPEQVQEEAGKMVNSDFLNGFDIKEAISKMMDHLEEKGWGRRVTTYHLRDWLISRQRYWGAPIPMIFCAKCAKEGKSYFDAFKEVKKTDNPQLTTHNSMPGWFPVPEEQLPVLLPDVKDWKPTGTGRGPLRGHPEFYETSCPHCGGPAERETDVCDTFLDSSWYFLRYPSVGQPDSVVDENLLDPQLDRDGSQVVSEGTVPPRMRSSQISSTPFSSGRLPWNNEINRKWLPVHSYIGGAEHTVLHLLYARFVWMAFKDWGLIALEDEKETPEYNPDEPFRRFFAHGLIIKDGVKMSKSKGNVVVPDEYIKLYGADTLRTYLMFLGPFEGGGDFRDLGIQGMYRWLSRVWRLVNQSANSQNENLSISSSDGQKMIAKTIKAVTLDMEELHYNTAIARLMEYTNWWMEHIDQVRRDHAEVFLKLLAAFAPHMTEELYQNIQYPISNIQYQISSKFESIHTQPWPTFDPKLVKEDEVTVIIQINGKMRDSIVVSVQSGKNKHEVEQKAKSSAKVQKWLQDSKIVKVIFVPGRLINFVLN